MAAEGGESMADAYDEMERLMKEYEALAQSDLPAALEKMIDLYFDETYENTFNYMYMTVSNYGFRKMRTAGCWHLSGNTKARRGMPGWRRQSAQV